MTDRIREILEKLSDNTIDVWKLNKDVGDIEKLISNLIDQALSDIKQEMVKGVLGEGETLKVIHKLCIPNITLKEIKNPKPNQYYVADLDMREIAHSIHEAQVKKLEEK